MADALGARVHYGARAVGVSRRGWDRLADQARDTEPLSVRVATADGEGRILARAVIDASGTWSVPSPLGGDGLLALGKSAATDHITYRVPDLTDPDVRQRYAGRRIVLAGSSHSALTALVAFAELAEQYPDTHVRWLLRRGQIGTAFGGGDADQLPARARSGYAQPTPSEPGRSPPSPATAPRASTARTTIGWCCPPSRIAVSVPSTR